MKAVCTSSVYVRKLGIVYRGEAVELSKEQLADPLVAAHFDVPGAGGKGGGGVQDGTSGPADGDGRVDGGVQDGAKEKSKGGNR